MSVESKRNYALVVLGMACYWPMFRNNYFGLLFSQKSVLISGSDCYYLALLGFLLLLGVLTGWRAAWITRILNRRWSIPLVALLASLATASMILISGNSSLHQVLYVACVIIFALNFLLITLAWGMLLATSDYKRIMFYLAISFFISYLLSSTSRLPGAWAYILPLCGPLISGLAWYLQPYAPGSFKPFTRTLFRQPLFRTVLVLILFLLIGSIIRGFFNLGVLGYAPSIETFPRALISTVMALVLVLAVYLSSQYERLINIFWVIFVLLFFTGLFVTAAFNAAWWQIGTDIVVMSRTFLGFFLWIVLINVAIRFKQSPLFLFGVFFIPTECLSGILTNYVVPHFSGQLTDVSQEFAGFFALAMALILLLGSFIYLGSLAFKRNAVLEESGESEEGLRHHICVLIADEHKLTVREREVLYFISQGHSIKHIADVLFVSVSTAQTHAKSLYRKLGLHSRQEVIDLVSARLSLE